jgi:glycosyltransferase involved in cell wall biosynthesis
MQSSTVEPLFNSKHGVSQPQQPRGSDPSDVAAALPPLAPANAEASSEVIARSGSGAWPDGRRVRALVFTTVFPNSAQPLHGLFIAERVKHIAKLADVRVVAPVPWYPWIRRRVPRRDRLAELVVEHPTFGYVPRVLKALDGICLFFASISAINRLRREFNFDLIDAHFAYPDGFAAVLLGWLFRRPVCVTLRGTIIPLSSDPLRRALCDWTIRRADRVIAVAQNLAVRARQGGVPNDRLAVIENGVDIERFRPESHDGARLALGLPTEARLIVSVGHLSQRKGFHRLLQILPSVLRDFSDLRLAIVGGRGAEPDNGPELRELARQFAVEDRVIFAGAEPPDRVALWLNAGDALVLASEFEGCPNVVMEALACGRPVVATKVGHVERMVPAFAGILVDLGDAAALTQAVRDVLSCEWDRRRIRGYAASHTWSAVAARVLSQWSLALRRTVAVGAPFAAARRIPREPER